MLKSWAWLDPLFHSSRLVGKAVRNPSIFCRLRLEPAGLWLFPELVPSVRPDTAYKIGDEVAIRLSSSGSWLAPWRTLSVSTSVAKTLLRICGATYHETFAADAPSSSCFTDEQAADEVLHCWFVRHCFHPRSAANSRLTLKELAVTGPSDAAFKRHFSGWTGAGAVSHSVLSAVWVSSRKTSETGQPVSRLRIAQSLR